MGLKDGNSYKWQKHKCQNRWLICCQYLESQQLSNPSDNSSGWLWFPFRVTFWIFLQDFTFLMHQNTLKNVIKISIIVKLQNVQIGDQYFTIFWKIDFFFNNQLNALKFLKKGLNKVLISSLVHLWNNLPEDLRVFPSV